MTRKRHHELAGCVTAEEIRERLRGLQIDVDDLVSRYLHAQADRGVLVVGSVADRTATSASDIDLMVLVNSRSSVLMPDGTVPIVTGRTIDILHYERGIEFNLEFFARPDWDPVAKPFLDVAPALYDPRDLKSLPLMEQRDLRFLHRLRTGWTLQGSDLVELWRDEFMVGLLPTYLAVSHFMTAVELVEDVRAFGSGPNGGVTLVGRVCLEYALLALLATTGITGQSRRWLAHWVAQVPDSNPSKPLACSCLDAILSGGDRVSELSFAGVVNELVRRVASEIRSHDRAIDQAIGFILTEIDYADDPLAGDALVREREHS